MSRKKITIQAIYRLSPVIFIIVIGLIGINNGVYFADIPNIGQETFAVQLYYIISLFLMSGIDLGMPIGGEQFYRSLVYAAYFLAPIIAVTSAIEAILRSVDPNFFKRKYKNHIIIIGASKLSLTRLDDIREEKIIIVDDNENNVNLEYFKKLKNIRFIIGDYESPNLIEKLNIDLCKYIWIFTDDDFQNIEIALRIKNTFINFEINKIHVRCESKTLYSDLALHPELQKIFNRKRHKQKGNLVGFEKFNIISNSQTLANIFYYKFFYQLCNADNIVIYGCNEFTDNLLYLISEKKYKRGEKPPVSKQVFPNLKKIIIIDDNKEVIKRKKEKQSLIGGYVKDYPIEYIFSEINNDTTHENIAKKLPLMDCTKYLLLKDNFHLNSKVAAGIITTINYQKPISLYFTFGNPADKLIYRGEATDFDSVISVNSKDIKGGSFYKTEDKLFLENLTQDGKSDTFKDVYCFNENYEIKNANNIYNQIEIDNEFEIKERGAGYVQSTAGFDDLPIIEKNEINRRIVEHSINKGQTVTSLKEIYEKYKDSDWGGDNFLLFRPEKEEDRKKIEHLFETLVNEQEQKENKKC